MFKLLHLFSVRQSKDIGLLWYLIFEKVRKIVLK